MRQGQQQNRRGRGRGRKPQNPLSRNFESNGPDVKIRGTAAHIAEKYVSLARDALVSGDIVQAENYLQHAEHYNRIIMAAQPQFSGPGQPPNDGPNGSGVPRQRVFGLNMDDDGDYDEQPNTQPPQRHDASRDGGYERRQGRGDTNGRGRGSGGGEGNGNGNGSDDSAQADEGSESPLT